MKDQVNFYDYPAKVWNRKVLVYFVGNGMDARYVGEYVKEVYHNRQIVMEYPGYGEQYGKQCPTESRVLKHAHALVRWLVVDQRIPLDKLVFLGISVGSGSATNVAFGLQHYLDEKRIGMKEEKHIGTMDETIPESIGGLVLVAGFTNIKGIVKDFKDKWLLTRLLLSPIYHCLSDRFRNIDLIGEVRAPTLFLHGKKDDLISYQQSVEMATKHYHMNHRHGGKTFLLLSPNDDHNSVFLNHVRELADWFKNLQEDRFKFDPKNKEKEYVR
jgi:hypothetical protein